MRTHLTRVAVLLVALAALLSGFAVTASNADARDSYAVEQTDDDAEICVIEGANICPPEELDIVFPCITTGMLAGETCPEHQAHEGKICIVEGANICPPHDLHIVFPCITTSLLAGEECPHPVEHKSDDTRTAVLATRG